MSWGLQYLLDFILFKMLICFRTSSCLYINIQSGLDVFGKHLPLASDNLWQIELNCYFTWPHKAVERLKKSLTYFFNLMITWRVSTVAGIKFRNLLQEYLGRKHQPVSSGFWQISAQDCVTLLPMAPLLPRMDAWDPPLPSSVCTDFRGV